MTGISRWSDPGACFSCSPGLADTGGRKPLGRRSARARLAALPSPAQTVSGSPHGINVHLASDAALAKVAEAGIPWIRIDVNWNAIEAERGRFDFSQVDRVVATARRHGLSIYATLAYTPGWANGGLGAAYPAADVNLWKNFVKVAVLRYRDSIRYWGIWNEPNVPEFYARSKDTFLNQVFLPAALEIRTSAPAAFVVGPELAHLTSSGSEWYFWLKYILQNAASWIDVVSHHVYEDRGVYYLYELLETGDGLLPSVKQVVADAGCGGKPFWVTEVGWQTAKVSEQTQADRYLEMLQKRASRNYPAKVFFYELSDPPAAGSVPWGILRANLSAKPAYGVYKDYIAGKYPGTEDPDPVINDKKCFAEQLTPAEGETPAAMLDALRTLREHLASAPDTRWAVRRYHGDGELALEAVLADRRLLDEATRLLAGASQLVRDEGFLALFHPLPAELQGGAARAADLFLRGTRDEPRYESLRSLLRQWLPLRRQPPLEWLTVLGPGEDDRGRRGHQPR